MKKSEKPNLIEVNSRGNCKYSHTGYDTLEKK